MLHVLVQVQTLGRMIEPGTKPPCITLQKLVVQTVYG